MEYLKICNLIQEEISFDNYLTSDRKYLHLNNLRLKQTFKTKLYDEFFDQLNLNQNTYMTVEEIYLETDLIRSIPKKIKKFKNLTELTISGLRFCNLNMINVPHSVKILSLFEQLNLKSDCILGMDQLIDLEEIYLAAETFRLDDLFLYTDRLQEKFCQNEIPIPNLPNLKIISFIYRNIKLKNELIENWMQWLKNDPLLSQIWHRIKNIIITNDDIVEQITIILK